MEVKASVRINILGSCVSRVAMLNGDTKGHGIAGEGLELRYFLDKQNIVCAMMPSAFVDEEIDSIDPECLYDKSRLMALKQCLNKKTVRMLMESDAEYLVMDLYDFHTDMMVYNGTMFSTCAHEFLNTHLYKENASKMSIANFMELPSRMWYPNVDKFFQMIMEKYDSDHIILNRFRSNRYYLGKDGFVKEIPDMYKKPWHSKWEYNDIIRQLEDYIIENYNPYVIDISKYYICDENKWENLNGAHFEQEFYEQTYSIIEDIVNGKADRRVYTTPWFLERLAGIETFNAKAEKTSLDENAVKMQCGTKLDIEQGLEMFLKLIEDEDPLWMNILTKLYEVAPEDARVQVYMQVMMEEVGEM